MHPDREEHPDYYLKTVDCDKCKGDGVDKYGHVCLGCDGSGEIEVDVRDNLERGDAP